MKLENSTVCITGGVEGLGASIVQLLVLVCKKVIVLDIQDQRFFHEKIEFIKCDLNKDFPKPQEVDIFISNAAISVGNKEFKDLSLAEIMTSINVNLTSTLKFYKLWKFKKFVFINSVVSMRGAEKYSMYCACKAFIRIFNQSLVRENNDTMIVYPYKIDTKMFKELNDRFLVLKTDYVAQEIIKGIETDKKEIYLPGIFKIMEFTFGILPNFMANILLNQTFSKMLPNNVGTGTSE